MSIKYLLEVTRERRMLTLVVFICLLLLSCWIGFIMYSFVMGVWTRLLPWLEPPYLFLLVICIVFLVINMNNSTPEKVPHARPYNYVSSCERYDSKSFSTPSEKRSFSTSSTSSASSGSLRARAEVNERVDDYIEQVHDRWKCERQMDDSPWESPISSPPPIHKMGTGKHQEGNKYAEALDEVLINLAYDQTLKKSKPTRSFNDEWWKAIIDGLFFETEIRYNKTQVKIRLNSLYSKWKAWNKVMNTPGFDWDPMEKTIRANDNNWISYIKVNPECKNVRASTFPMYEELTAIFNSLDAASMESFTACQKGNTNPKFNESHPCDSSDCKSTSSGNSTVEVPYEINAAKKVGSGNQNNLRRIIRPSDFDKARNESRSSELLEVVKFLVEVIKHKDRANIRPISDASVSITACIKVLQEMKGIQPTSKSVYKAIEMFQSPGWRDTFMAMTADLRMGWLQNLK